MPDWLILVSIPVAAGVAMLLAMASLFYFGGRR